MVTVIAAINEFERANLLERQREGITIAKNKGVYKGRKPITFTDKEFSDAYEEYLSRKITKTALAEKLNITRPTLDKILREKGL
jgi:DNA invertase Pin-like site-specific DNA recombinase